MPTLGIVSAACDREALNTALEIEAKIQRQELAAEGATLPPKDKVIPTGDPTKTAVISAALEPK